ncbi:MAG: hypothetical protein A2Y36_09910 [Treponema sp. GWA1_62_8]|nr:MAG: hypothetical protein A2Y36_09910 [Treponema sp. GWA1_62_8]
MFEGFQRGREDGIDGQAPRGGVLETVDDEALLQVQEDAVQFGEAQLAVEEGGELGRRRFVEAGDGRDQLAVGRVQIGRERLQVFPTTEEARELVHQALLVEGRADVAQVAPDQVEEGDVVQGKQGRFPGGDVAHQIVLSGRSRGAGAALSSSSVQCWMEYL